MHDSLQQVDDLNLGLAESCEHKMLAGTEQTNELAVAELHADFVAADVHLEHDLLYAGPLHGERSSSLESGRL